MPRQIHILITLLALFVITYIVVDTFYRVVGIQLHRAGVQKTLVLKDVEGGAAKPLAAPDSTMLLQRNIFGAAEKAEAPPVEATEELVESLEETTLQLALLGTVAGDAASARAIIMDQKERSQDIYRVGDTVQDAEIRQILRGRVILRRGEKDEVLSMAGGDDPAQAAPAVPGRGIDITPRSAAARARRVFPVPALPIRVTSWIEGSIRSSMAKCWPMFSGESFHGRDSSKRSGWRVPDAGSFRVSAVCFGLDSSRSSTNSFGMSPSGAGADWVW